VFVAALGGSAVFAINAASFVVSLVLTLTIRGRFQAHAEAASGAHRGIAAGIAFALHDWVVLRITIAWLVFVLGMGIAMVADAALAEHFDAGPLGYGLLLAFLGTGSVLGSLAGRWASPRTAPSWMVLGSAGIAVTAVLVGSLPLFSLVLVAVLLLGTSNGAAVVADSILMQHRVPDEVRSRTFAAVGAVISFGFGISYIVAAPILRAVGPQAAYRIAGVGAAVAALVLLPLMRLRESTPRADDDERAAPPEFDIPAGSPGSPDLA
jgi:MFS family permease